MGDTDIEIGGSYKGLWLDEESLPGGLTLGTLCPRSSTDEPYRHYTFALNSNKPVTQHKAMNLDCVA